MTRYVRWFFLGTLLVSVAIAALLGIIAVLGGLRGEAEEKLLVTAITVALTSLACFLSALPLEKKRLLWVAIPGLAFAVTAGALSVLVIWLGEDLAELLRPGAAYRAWELIMKALMTFIGPGIFFPLSAVLLWPRLRSGAQAVPWVTVGLAAMALGVGLLGMWAEVEVEYFWRCWAVGLILTLAGTAATPILARFFAIKTQEELTIVTRFVWVRCPRCLREQDLPVGESRCAHCKLKFKLEVEEPRCRQCGYILHGLTRPICPECGAVFDSAELASTPVPPVLSPVREPPPSPA